MKFINNEKGVTLVVLIVTVIIMLILAGVSIVASTGQNGVLTKSSELREEARIRGEQENQILQNVVASVGDEDKTSTGEEKEAIDFETALYAYLMDSDSDGTADLLVLSSSDSSKFDLGSFGKIKGNYGDELYDTNTGKPKWESEKSNIIRVIVRTNIVPSETDKVNEWFSNCTNLRAIRNLYYIDTGNVTDMSGMFQNCEKIQELNVTNFNTENVTNMSNMFYNCKAVQNLDLSRFDTSRVTNMSFMLFGCESALTINVNNFNTVNVTNMQSMFQDCKSVNTLNLRSFNNHALETGGAANMFAGTANLASISVTGINFDIDYSMFGSDEPKNITPY